MFFSVSFSVAFFFRFWEGGKQIPESTLRSFSFACEEVVAAPLEQNRGEFEGRERRALRGGCRFQNAR